MTPAQQQILDTVTNKLKQKKISRFVYYSEYLGYLPYGQYQWIECGDEDISAELPAAFSYDDLKELENLERIRFVKKWINPKDETESKTTYELTNDSEGK